MGYDAEIRQPLDRADWEQREIYAHLGLAVYFCQVVETALVNYLVLLHRATTRREMAEAEVDDLFVELFGQTLGWWRSPNFRKLIALSMSVPRRCWPSQTCLKDSCKLSSNA